MLNDDWRLQNATPGLQGSGVRHRRYSMPRPDWDHDHCILCWQKLAEPSVPDSVHEGYVLSNDDWLCTECYDLFAERLELQKVGDDRA